MFDVVTELENFDFYDECIVNCFNEGRAKKNDNLIMVALYALEKLVEERKKVYCRSL